MGGGKLDREGGLKTSLAEKGASCIRELGGGGSLFEGMLNVPINSKPTHVPPGIHSAFDWSFALYRRGFNPNHLIGHLTFVSKYWSASQAKGLCNSFEMHSFCIWEPLKKSVKCIHANSPGLSRSLLNTALISGSPVQVIKSPTKTWLLYFSLL